MIVKPIETRNLKNYERTADGIAFVGVWYKDELYDIVPIKYTGEKRKSYEKECCKFAIDNTRDSISEAYTDHMNIKDFTAKIIMIGSSSKDGIDVVYFRKNDHMSLAYEPKYHSKRDKHNDWYDATEYWLGRGWYDGEIAESRKNDLKRHTLEAPTLGLMASSLKMFMQKGWKPSGQIKCGYIIYDTRPLWWVDVKR